MKLELIKQINFIVQTENTFLYGFIGRQFKIPYKSWGEQLKSLIRQKEYRYATILVANYIDTAQNCRIIDRNPDLEKTAKKILDFLTIKLNEQYS